MKRQHIPSFMLGLAIALASTGINKITGYFQDLFAKKGIDTVVDPIRLAFVGHGPTTAGSPLAYAAAAAKLGFHGIGASSQLSYSETIAPAGAKKALPEWEVLATDQGESNGHLIKHAPLEASAGYHRKQLGWASFDGGKIMAWASKILHPLGDYAGAAA